MKGISKNDLWISYVLFGSLKRVQYLLRLSLILICMNYTNRIVAAETSRLPPESPLCQYVSNNSLNGHPYKDQDVEQQNTEADQEASDEIDDVLKLADQPIESLLKTEVVAPSMDVEVTTVERSISTVGRSAAAIYVVTNEMIQRSAARTIPDVLRLVPGVDVARLSASRWAISIRGFNDIFANKLLVQIDGRTVYQPDFAGVYWDEMNLLLEDIERIEVIRGPGATIWGENAVNGVINIITKKACDTQGLFVQGGGGTEERNFGSVRYGDSIGDSLHYRVFGKWEERGCGWNDSEATDAADDGRMARAGFRMDWEPDDCTIFTLQGDFLAGKAGQRVNSPLEPEPPPISPPPYQIPGVRGDEFPVEHNILTRLSRQVSDESDWALQFFWTRNQRPVIPEDYEPIFRTWNMFDMDFQHRFPIGCRQSLIWGFGYRNTRSIIDGNYRIDFDPTVRSFDRISYFFQDRFELREDLLYFTVGSKFSHNDFSGFEYQPTIRLLWTPDERRTMWGSISRAVRTPTRTEEDLISHQSEGEFIPAFIEINGGDVIAEELLAYEIGYRAQPNDAFWWDITLFYNDYDNVLNFVPGVPFVDPTTGMSVLPATIENAVWGDTYGFELATTFEVNPCWRLRSVYSFLVMNLHGIDAEAIEGRSPRNQFNFQSHWDLGRSLELDMIWRYVDNLPALDTSDYLVMDVRLAWESSKNMEISIVGRNLLDAKHMEYASRNTIYSSEVQWGCYGMVTLRH